MEQQIPGFTAALEALRHPKPARKRREPELGGRRIRIVAGGGGKE